MPSRRLTLGAILVFLFLPAIAIRAGEFRYPLGDGQQWLTSTVVRTQQIWATDGIARRSFRPVMTYDGPANRNIDNQASIADAQGNWYYTSYGPLSYITPYLLTSAVGKPPTATWLGWFNIWLHAATALLLFMLVAAITKPLLFRDYAPALVAFVIYAWTPETLWYHSKPYMADMFVQPLFALGALLFVRHLDTPTNKRAASLAFVIMLAVTTEWLGVLLGVAVIAWGAFNWKVRASRSAAISAALGIAAGLAAILIHYSSIAGPEAFIRAATGKYAVRAGAASTSAFTLLGIDGWRVLAGIYWRGYWPVITAVALIASTFSWRREAMTERHESTRWKPAFVIALLPVALHHLLFFDFTAEHPFSALKTAVPLSLFAAFLAHRAVTERETSHHGGAIPRVTTALLLLAWPVTQVITRARSGSTPGKLITTELVIVLVASVVAILAIERHGDRTSLLPRRYAVILLLMLSTAGSVIGYKAIAVLSRNGWYAYLGSTIARRARPDEVVFISDARNRDYPALPMTVLYARRNLAEWHGIDEARALVKKNGAVRGVYFAFDSTGTPDVARFDAR